MPALTLVGTVVALTAEQLLGWTYGVSGAVGLLLLALGVTTRRPSVSSAGAVVLALLVARPAL
jgi:phytoene/squalene synthetase